MADEKADERVAARDAFSDLYRRYVPTVRAQVRMWIAPDEVDEIVSSTFVTAWRKFDQITPGSEKAWLLGVARNHCRNRYRARRRSDALVDAVARAIPPGSTEGSADAADAPDLAPLLRALRTLGPDEQELLALSVWQELTPAEIAAVLDVRQGTIRVRLHRARRRLETEYLRIRAEEAGSE